MEEEGREEEEEEEEEEGFINDLSSDFSPMSEELSSFGRGGRVNKSFKKSDKS